MKNKRNTPETIISTLWIFVLLNITFRDFHQLGSPGFLEGMIRGEVNGMKITDQLALIGGVLVEIPILMVLLSRILDDQWNKWSNVVAGIITLIVFATALPYADMDDIFHFVFELGAIGWIFILAWQLPQRKEVGHESVSREAGRINTYN